MSREIRFRGKRTDNGEWVEGYLFCCWNQTYIIREMIKNNPAMKEVDPETVCQYTGLPDKNGMNICEEDFVKIDNEWIGRVVWSPTEAAFIVFPNDDIEHEKYCLGYYVYEHDVVEIIGNIFDNPELLEGGKSN